MICGPIAAERERAYLTLVRSARSLAAQGLETLFRLNYGIYRPGRESMMPVRSTVLAEFRQVASEQNKKLAALADDLVLLESGLDSLCFAIIVARLEDTLGVDPFTSTEKAAFPVTLGDFIKFYEDAVK